MFDAIMTGIQTTLDTIGKIGETSLAVLEIGILITMFFGDGWLVLIRNIAFWLDQLIINYIDKFYGYFDKLLAGQIFSADVVSDVMRRVYIFVALFILVKLMILFMKYLTNPEMVSDDKLGSAALVKRVIIGMCLMLFLPTIFDLGIGFQRAILKDNIFGTMLLNETQLEYYEQNQSKMGRILGFNVYQAFWSINTSANATAQQKKEYEKVIAEADPGMLGLTGINDKDGGGEFIYDYFPFVSSMVLAVVLYLIIKYCLDVVVRMFKLFLLQLTGPLAITDYMINGDSNNMFKNWTKTTLSVYLMLFIRIFSIWFIAFVTSLMQTQCRAGEVCNSLLYKSNPPDYLMRGIITIGLLVMLLDLPKFFSELFGLDLEQDATVKGIMQKGMNAVKGVGLGAMAAGGAAIGGAMGGLKSGTNAIKGKIGAKVADKNAAKGGLSAKNGEGDKRMADINQNRSQANQIKNQASSNATKDMSSKSSSTSNSALSNKANNINKQSLSATSTNANSSSNNATNNNNATSKHPTAAKVGKGILNATHGVTTTVANTAMGALKAGLSTAAQSIGGPAAASAFGAYDQTKAATTNSSGFDTEKYLKNKYDIPEEEQEEEQSEPETVSGVEVGAPDPATGERTTKSGIILSSNVPTDSNKNN